MYIFSLRKDLQACPMRTSLTKFENVFPVLHLKYLQKDVEVILAIAEISSSLMISVKFFIMYLYTALNRSRSFLL